VRHTSNELYVDILESLSVILAPSGQPISAITAGSIAFTAKISGVPDLLLVLNAPGGTSSSKSSGIARTMQLPVFHPCVRLAWWKEHPGELSFVPPDGRFVLAGYEVDLLPSNADIDRPPGQAENLFLPASVDMRTGLGAAGSDFEVKLTLNNNFPGTHSSSRPGPSSSRLGAVNPSFSFGGAGGSSTSAPALEAVVVTVAIPDGVRNVANLRCSRGEANYSQWTKTLEWKVPTKDGATINGTATLTGSIMGLLDIDDSDEDIENGKTGSKTNPLLGYYDEDSATAAETYQASTQTPSAVAKSVTPIPFTSSLAQQRKAQANKLLMPTSVAVSFNVRGWLPSGIKVDSLNVDVRRSKGLGEGVRPYKGVKYVTVSRSGVERRV
jgi:AP-3 complex subunit mu